MTPEFASGLSFDMEDRFHVPGILGEDRNQPGD